MPHSTHRTSNQDSGHFPVLEKKKIRGTEDRSTNEMEKGADFAESGHPVFRCSFPLSRRRAQT